MVRVGVVQTSTVMFNTPATLTKLQELTKEAVAQGAEIVLFPEAFVGGYVKGLQFDLDEIDGSDGARDEFMRYHNSAITFEGPESQQITDTAREHNVYLVVPVIEKDGGTLYCSVFFYGPDGTKLGRHRKLKPTKSERVVWGQGDGSMLPVFDTPLGRIGSAICWENYMPPLRTRRFLQLIRERVSEVCLRHIICAVFHAPNEENKKHGSSYVIEGDAPGREKAKDNGDATLLFSEFMQLLRGSYVACWDIRDLVFTPALAALILQTLVVSDALRFEAGSCAELTPVQFHNVVRHFSPTSLDIDRCHLHAGQITVGFLRDLRTNRVRQIQFLNMVPVDGGSFPVTDDAIIDFCVQEDAPIGQARRPDGELVVCNGTFTKDLFKRLVEASSVSKRAHPLRIAVSPVRVEDDDLRDFEHRLSHPNGGTQRVYDFPGEQHGAVAAMHLQIVLHADNSSS
ncbi:hypothetical protein AAVH_12015 [Aphelenchoides avenae]|nr:hypothetical protein AAVH_12015 [Aphelenchus avenae]